MTASRERRGRRSATALPVALIRLLALVALTGLVVAACSDDDGGAGFASDPGPIDPALLAALGDDVDPRAVPRVQREFLEMCVEGVDGPTEQLAPLERSGLLAVCGCSYEAIVSDLSAEADGDSADERDRAAYNAFRAIESDLRAGNPLDPAIEGLVADCIRTEAGL